jgi:plastocyanin
MFRVRSLALALTASSLVAFAAATAAAQGQAVEVQLSSYAFTPKTLTLHHGTSYTLRLVNDSKSGHSFSAPELFASSTIAPQDQSKVDGGKIEVRKGGTVEVSFTPNTPGTYGVKCTHPFHAGFGMKGTVVVD